MGGIQRREEDVMAKTLRCGIKIENRAGINERLKIALLPVSKRGFDTCFLFLHTYLKKQ